MMKRFLAGAFLAATLLTTPSPYHSYAQQPPSQTDAAKPPAAKPKTDAPKPQAAKPDAAKPKPATPKPDPAKAKADTPAPKPKPSAMPTKAKSVDQIVRESAGKGAVNCYTTGCQFYLGPTRADLYNEAGTRLKSQILSFRNAPKQTLKPGECGPRYTNSADLGCLEPGQVRVYNRPQLIRAPKGAWVELEVRTGDRALDRRLAAALNPLTDGKSRYTLTYKELADILQMKEGEERSQQVDFTWRGKYKDPTSGKVLDCASYRFTDQLCARVPAKPTPPPEQPVAPPPPEQPVAPPEQPVAPPPPPPSKVTLRKQWINDNGGKQTGAVEVFLNDNQYKLDNEMEITLDQGEYTAKETPVQGYTTRFEGPGCDASGKIIARAGETSLCTIINDDIPPTVTLRKDVVNDDGRKKTREDFKDNYTVGGQKATEGQQITVKANEPVKIDEKKTHGYKSTITGTAADGTVMLQPGQNIVIPIENNDTPMRSLRFTGLYGPTQSDVTTRIPLTSRYCPTANCEATTKQDLDGRKYGGEVEYASRSVLLNVQGLRTTLEDPNAGAAGSVRRFFGSDLRRDLLGADAKVALTKWKFRPVLNAGGSYTRLTITEDGARDQHRLREGHIGAGAGVGNFTGNYATAIVGMSKQDVPFVYGSPATNSRPASFNATMPYGQISGRTFLFNNHAELFGTGTGYLPRNAVYSFADTNSSVRVTNKWSATAGAQGWLRGKDASWNTGPRFQYFWDQQRVFSPIGNANMRDQGWQAGWSFRIGP